MTDRMCDIDMHADDYALTVRTSEEMLALMHEGVFDSISIIPNSECFDECMDLLKRSIPELPFLPKMSVHLNLVEGSDAISWRNLFIASFIPFYRTITRSKISKEITAQISNAQDKINECIIVAGRCGITCLQKRLRIDSHQHSHMIPVVWDALMDSITENGFDPEYIRNSAEPLIPFLTKPSFVRTYRPVNIIKNRLLWLLSGKVDRYNKAHGHDRMYLWGLIMSGRMDAPRIAGLFPALCSYAHKNNRTLEILFHPGRMTENEATPAIPADAAKHFYLSSDRDLEKKGAVKCRSLVSF